MITTDRNDPRLNVTDNTGQQEAYLVLSEEERAKGFVRLIRSTYIHVGVNGYEINPNDMSKHGRTGNACGVATKMGTALSETYARDPNFYGATYCVGCGTHLPVNEFKWEDGEVVGS